MSRQERMEGDLILQNGENIFTLQLGFPFRTKPHRRLRENVARAVSGSPFRLLVGPGPKWVR